MRSMGIVMVLAALASTPLGAAELSRQVTDVTAIVEPEMGAGRVIFRADISVEVLAKEILQYDVPNRGFILTIDPGQGLGLPGEDLSRLGALSGATVEVQYRPVPPRGRRAS